MYGHISLGTHQIRWIEKQEAQGLDFLFALGIILLYQRKSACFHSPTQLRDSCCFPLMLFVSMSKLYRAYRI